METEEKKRLFFGCELAAPWPQKYPKGRLLNEQQRHVTLAFLGNVDYRALKLQLPSIPSLELKVGLIGQCDACLPLPANRPRVIAWHVNLKDPMGKLMDFRHRLITWLKNLEYKPDEREFLPHVTICRSPFDVRDWQNSFSPLPCFIKDLHLYESVGDLQYQRLWSLPILAPFEEVDHTADIAFQIRGETLSQIYRNAQAALAFRFPALLPFLSQGKPFDSLERIIMELNEVVSVADGEIGCPFKAISFHGDLIQENGLLNWEMIIDV